MAAARSGSNPRMCTSSALVISIPGMTASPAALSGPLHGCRIFGRVVVAHRDGIQPRPDGGIHQRRRMHVQLGAWREACVDVCVDHKHLQTGLLPRIPGRIKNSDDIKSLQRRGYDRDADFFGSGHRVRFRLPAVYQHDGRQTVQLGYGHDVHVLLHGDPDIALAAVSHHIREQVRRIAALDLPFRCGSVRPSLCLRIFCAASATFMVVLRWLVFES